jgi:transposase
MRPPPVVGGSLKPPSPSDLTDAEWPILISLIRAPIRGGRPIMHVCREVVRLPTTSYRERCWPGRSAHRDPPRGHATLAWVGASTGQVPPPLSAAFPVLPRRWVVERTFARLGWCHRLSKDNEYQTGIEKAWMQLAMIHLMIRRLAQ